MTVTAATKWDTNAEMILDIVELGYIRPTDVIIDLTYGRGAWWTKYQHPGEFWANLSPDDEMGELPPYMNAWMCRDFRDLGEEWGSFDVALFDPPYVSMGGRATSGLPDFMDRYGLENAATTPELLHADNVRGLAEAMRIVKPGGLILAKCAPYVSSGVRKEGDWWTRDAALEMGLKVEDMLIHIGDVRAQPKVATCRKCGGDGFIVVGHEDDVALCEECPRCHGAPPTVRQQKHARNNYSVLFVFKKPKPRKPRRKKEA